MEPRLDGTLVKPLANPWAMVKILCRNVAGYGEVKVGMERLLKNWELGNEGGEEGKSRNCWNIIL